MEVVDKSLELMSKKLFFTLNTFRKLLGNNQNVSLKQGFNQYLQNGSWSVDQKSSAKTPTLLKPNLRSSLSRVQRSDFTFVKLR